MYGTVYTIDQAFDSLMRDKAYYDRSGGGVTIGGGEATMSFDFTYALMKKLQDAGIHVAIDTCGYMVNPKSLKILENADLVLFDIKGMDPEKHRKNTGVDNGLILETLLHLGRRNKDIIIRLPMVPGRNDDDETLKQEAALITSVGSVKRIDVIPYHDYGSVKYKRIGKPYQAEGTPFLTDERKQEIVDILRTTGIPVQIGG